VQGPNVKKLIAHKMSLDTVPRGGGFKDAVAFLSDPKGITSAARSATVWVEAALAAVRAAPDCRPGITDEEIAADILARIEAKLKQGMRGP
jgi:hypothetical protein